MRLANVIAGARAIKRETITLQNCAEDDGGPKRIEIGFRALLGTEQSEVYRLANEYAKKHGSVSCNDDDPIWSLANAVYTLAISAVDPDSDPKQPSPFFGASPSASVEERATDILSNELIGRDTILYLAELQELWQDEVNPQIRSVSPEDMWAMVAEVTKEGSARPFLRWRPGLRLIFMHFLASQLANSLNGNSSPGEDFAENLKATSDFSG